MIRKYKEYFDYYLELENDFFSTEPYVSIELDNYKTYSTQYAKIYLSICSEIDCLLKEICRNTERSTTANSIDKYFPIINSHFPNFKIEGVYFEKQKLELFPWEEWENNKSPDWWKYYNKIKHHRLEEETSTGIEYYKYANLENVINALAALYIVEQYYLYSYDYLSEAEIPVELKNSFITLEEIADDEKGQAMYALRSKRCSIRRWKDNNCYFWTYTEKYADLEAMDYTILCP